MRRCYVNWLGILVQRLCAAVCVYVCDKEGGRERESKREKERDREIKWQKDIGGTLVALQVPREIMIGTGTAGQ